MSHKNTVFHDVMFFSRYEQEGSFAAPGRLGAPGAPWVRIGKRGLRSHGSLELVEIYKMSWRTDV